MWWGSSICVLTKELRLLKVFVARGAEKLVFSKSLQPNLGGSLAPVLIIDS